jgi:AcrR family transcriptional regulator
MCEERIKTGDAKDRILESARRLFADKGYTHVTIREVARAAQCSHTAVYMYYPTKCSLFAAVALPPLRALLQRVQDKKRDGQVAKRRLMEMAGLFVGFAVKYRRLYDALILQSIESSEEPAAVELEQVRRSLYEELKQAMHSAVQFTAGGADVLEQEQAQAADMFFYTLHGLVAAHLHSGRCTEEVVVEIRRRTEAAVDVTVGGCAMLVSSRPRYVGQLALSSKPL